MIYCYRWGNCTKTFLIVFVVVSVPDQADGRLEGGERQPAEDLRAAGDLHHRDREEQLPPRGGEQRRQGQDQEVRPELCFIYARA